MADCKFAQEQLAKFGWVEGSGLGKDEQGMKNPIKVAIKNNKKGVGHDPGKEFTNNWWDKMFNEAANSITVNNSKDGVEVQKTKLDDESDKKKSKNVLYGNFVKTSTLTNTEDGCSQEIRHEVEMVEEEDSRGNIKKYTVTDEEMFLKCGGRTAHKGARHGLKLNGKLKRIEEHEALLLKQMQEKLKSQKTPHETGTIKLKTDMCNELSEDTEIKKKKKKKKVKCDIELDNSDVCVKKKKSKKRKSDNVDDNVNNELNEYNDNNDCNVEEDSIVKISKKKKKKKKHKDCDL